MAKKEKNENAEATVEADAENQDSVSELEPDEEVEETDESEDDESSEPSEKKKFQFRDLVESVLYHKWILLAVLGLGFVFIIIGLSLKIGPKWLNRQGNNPFGTASKEIVEDNLQQEMFSPFFIPLPPSSSKEVVRIDLTVVCDGLAEVRLKKNELQIRHTLYQHILDLVKEHEDLDKKVSFLEIELGGIVKASLGVNELEVKIKEINYF